MAPTLRMLDLAGGPDPGGHAVVSRRTTGFTGRALSSTPLTAPAETKLSVEQELAALRRENGKLQQAVYEAAQLQRTLCAPRELVWNDYEIAGEIFPVRHLSGDFFKVMELDSALGLAVGDIAGKGMTAGIWQAHLMGLVQRAARTHLDPADVVSEVNRGLCQDHTEPPIAALFFARLDPESNVLSFCNAGLPAPFVLRGNSVSKHSGANQFGIRERIESPSPQLQNSSGCISLEEGGPMLGAVPEAKYRSGQVYLNPGDLLVAYSDGATECRNALDEEFETHRLASAADAVRGKSANQALFSTIGAVLDFAGTCKPGDDLTLLVLHRRVEASQDDHGNKDSSRPSPWAASVEPPKKGDRRGNGSK